MFNCIQDEDNGDNDVHRARLDALTTLAETRRARGLPVNQNYLLHLTMDDNEPEQTSTPIAKKRRKMIVYDDESDNDDQLSSLAMNITATDLSADLQHTANIAAAILDMPVSSECKIFICLLKTLHHYKKKYFIFIFFFSAATNITTNYRSRSFCGAMCNTIRIGRTTAKHQSCNRITGRSTTEYQLPSYPYVTHSIQSTATDK